MTHRKTYRPDEMSDDELRPFLERLFDDKAADDSNFSERVFDPELFESEIKLSAFAPLCTINNKNPLHHCIEHANERKAAVLYLKINEIVERIPASLGIVPVESSVGTREEKLRLPENPNSTKSTAESFLAAEISLSGKKLSGDVNGGSIPPESHLRKFTLEVVLPRQISIIAAEVYSNPNKLPVESIASPCGHPTAISTRRLALLTCRSINETENRFELLCNASRESLTALGNVLVLRVKEITQ